MKNLKRVLPEGAFTNSFFRNKFRRNKNTLFGITGATGSGKSYACLRIAELWYKEKFNKPFPIENVTFSNGETMKRLSSGKLEKGELLIPEEVGVNLGNLDFQTKVSKMINYTLQSFRSMNVGLLMNLPVLTMLNKSARLLLHGHFITTGIDFNTKCCTLKPFLHQLNQSTGKSYWKYPQVIIKGKRITLERLSYSLPTPELINAYEKKKQKFLLDLTQEYSAEFDKIEYDKIKAMARQDLTDTQMEVFNMLKEGLSVKQIAEKRGVGLRRIYTAIELIKKKGFALEKSKKSQENAVFAGQKPTPEHFKSTLHLS